MTNSDAAPSPPPADPLAPPRLTAVEHAGMKDFHACYETHHDDIRRDLMRLIEGLPHLARVIERTTPAQLEEQSRASRELMRQAIVDGVWGPLLRNQRQQGATYAAMGVPFREWFDLVGGFQKTLVPHLVEAHRAEPARLAAAIIAASIYIDVAMSTIADEYLRTKERIISQQRVSIEELSTPVLLIRDRMLLVPLVGVLDTDRARRLTEQLLHAVRLHRAKVVVIDITGVPAVDSKVANHLFQTVAAARLMGARAIVTGLSADVAQALVALGVDVERLNTVGDLQEGLEEADLFLARRARAGDPAFAGDV
jgi:rsbT co-antagonist protein RsbR